MEKLRKFRSLIQTIFFALFLFLFFNLRFPFEKNIFHNFFFKIDPLIALILSISGKIVFSTVIMSGILIILTLIFGRFFCGWICPMGSVFDFSAKFITLRKTGSGKKKDFGEGKYKNIKYYMLAFIFIGTGAGFTAFIFFDPTVFIYRVFTLNIYPFLIILINGVAGIIRPFALKAGFLGLYSFSIPQPAFAFSLLNLSIFISIIALVYFERRFWCRNLCPLGALLSIFSKFSLFGREVSSKCIECSKCAKKCPMNSISDNFRKTSSRECIQCMECQPVCPEQAISFSFSTKSTKRFEHDPSRRGLIYSGILGIAAGFTAISSPVKKTAHGTRLRPPGSIIEDDFLESCLRCGECMKVCPTKGLQPAFVQSGFEGFFTPVLIPRIGGCEEQCNLCGQVCPTGAVRNISLEEKQYAVIGNATIEKNICIAWEQSKICMICDEVCPYDAIEFRMVTDDAGTLQRPFVLEDKCVGCGQCEKACPVNGPAAIHVIPVNEVRKNSGSYITEKVKKLREVRDKDKDFFREYNQITTDKPDSTAQVLPPDDGEEELPEGIIQ